MEILLIAVAVVAAVFYFLYVTLIKRRNTAREALSSIDVQLRKRHDLVPNVVKLAQKFMTHERELLEGITKARNLAQAGYSPDDPDAVARHLGAEQQLQAGLMKFFAVAEAYPELRSAETIQNAQQTVNEVEGHIAAARRFYNSAVTDLNNAVEIWPSSMIAGMVGVKQMPFFEIEDEAARAPVDVTDYMN
ncbi:MAG: LemA family protein [Alphaproteobacteria bacterium]